MPTVVHRYTWRFNRKKVFQKKGVRLWIAGGGQAGAVLIVEKLKPGTSSAWKPLWTGRDVPGSTGVSIREES